MSLQSSFESGQVRASPDVTGYLKGSGLYLAKRGSGVVNLLLFRVALRGCATFSEKAFVGQCELFVCLDLVHFFSFLFALGHEARRFTNRVSVL